MEKSLTLAGITLSEPNTGTDIQPRSTRMLLSPVMSPRTQAPRSTATIGVQPMWLYCLKCNRIQLEQVLKDVSDTVKGLIECSPGQFVAADSYKPTLIVLADKNSDAAKDFCGTQWRNAQFCRICGSNPRDDRFLPATLDFKNNGVNLTGYRHGEPVHRATVEFDVGLQVQDYKVIDRIRRRAPKKGNNKRATSSYHEEDDAGGADSYVVMHSTTEGGVGHGLDYDDPSLTADDGRVLSYAKLLTVNFHPSPLEQMFPPTVVCLRIKANHRIRWLQSAELAGPPRGGS
ncbi:hypothetical protein BDW69DRAFT_184924 [Aspergillus filifer]